LFEDSIVAFAWRDWKSNKSRLTYFENDTVGMLAKRATAILTYAVDRLLQLEMCSVLKRVISSAILSLVLMLGLFIPIDNYSSGLKNSIYISS
jgi:hypothetical protein